VVQTLTDKNSIVEAEITQCENSVFVGSAEDVLMEKKYLSNNHPSRDFYVLEDEIQLSNEYWIFFLYGNSKVPFYYRQFITSGIMDKLNQVKSGRYYLDRRNETTRLKMELETELEAIALNLNGPILTTFYLLFGMLIICVLGYSFEIYEIVIRSVWIVFLTIRSICKQFHKGFRKQSLLRDTHPKPGLNK